jgi:hypothetical protein
VPGRGRAGRTRPGRRDPASAAAGSAGRVVPWSRAVTVTDQGITVYPARCEGDRWRAVWYEVRGHLFAEAPKNRKRRSAPYLAPPHRDPVLVADG